MVVVNAAMVVTVGEGAVTYDILVHAPWAGVTLADVVFPFFLFILGVAIPFSLGATKESSGLDRAAFQTILKRSLMLVLLGLALNAITLWRIDGESLRWLGVLQRIGLVYFLAAIIYLKFGWRVIAGIPAGILILYWPLALMAYPGGAADLTLPGANFISWFEREYLGPHIYVAGAAGFDPEGLLSTLPATAGTLLGVLTGVWIRTQSDATKRLKGLAGFGLLAVFLGFHWGLAFPMVKALWTSSYVLYNTGLALLTLAALAWLVDEKGPTVTGLSRVWAAPFKAFGVNAIAAYILHILLLWTLREPLLEPLYWLVDNIFSPRAASVPPVVILLLLTTLPIAVMAARGWRVRV